MVRTNLEAENVLRRLELQRIDRLVEALREDQCDESIIEGYLGILEEAQSLSPEEIEGLRSGYGGDVLADCIIGIQRLRHLTRPIPARGWRRIARWLSMVVLPIAGAAGAHPDGSGATMVFGAALGLVVATIINWFWLGGRPELRHGVNGVVSPASIRRYSALQEAVGPSSLKTRLQEANIAS